MHPAFSQTNHRPWGLPTKPWIMKQSWHDLLFLHWKVAPDEIRARLPKGLELDTYKGDAYIALVPFMMRGVTGRGCPAPKAMCDFPEFNVRTYVTVDGKPGVWFFSLDVTNAFAVWAARTFFHLNYRKSDINYYVKGDTIHYQANYSPEERFHVTYRPTKRYYPELNSFAHWATERYCLYAASKSGTLYRGEIQHPQWELWEAEYEIIENSMLDQFTTSDLRPPLITKDINVVVYPLEKLG